MIALSLLKTAMRASDTTDEDAYLLELEAAAVAHIQNMTGRYYGAAAAVTQQVIGGGHERLWLAEPAATLPVSVKERSGAGADEITITAANSDGYEFRHGSMALVRKAGVWGQGYEYEVTYTRGYAQTGNGAEASIAAPPEVREAVMILATWWYEQRIPAALGTVAPEVENHLRSILRQKRRRPWA